MFDSSLRRSEGVPSLVIRLTELRGLRRRAEPAYSRFVGSCGALAETAGVIGMAVKTEGARLTTKCSQKGDNRLA